MNTSTDQIDCYLKRLEALYQDVEAWLSDQGLRFDRRLIPMDEGVGEPYDAPALVIHGAGGEQVATVKPYGWNIIGAEGQVRVVGPYDTRIVSYFIDNGPSLNAEAPNAEASAGGRVAEQSHRYVLSGIGEPGWYVIADPKTGATQRLNGELLEEILAEVSDYGT